MRPRVRRALVLGAWLGAAAGFAAIALAALDRLFPLPPRAAPVTTVVLARDGYPLRVFPDAAGVWRYPVLATDVSPLYREALIHYEDRWFYRHPGVNPPALARALWQRLRYGRIISGGSTLTMQVARLLDPQPRTTAGKLRQCLRALQLEWHLSKAEILTVYLNRAPYGGVVEGVQAASLAYLGKPAHDLTAAEAALLVVLPQSPSRLRPDRSPAAAQAARDKVLDRMAQRGVWSAARIADAKREPVGAGPRRPPLLAPLFAERMRRTAPQAPVIRTTLDTGVQALLETHIAAAAAALPPRTSIAMLVVENATLAVRGYVGSADFGDPERFAHLDMVGAVRSPGSTLKPFLYALALDDGLVHSESLLVDAPTSFDGYQPANFSAAFSGPVSVSEALARSLNVPAVDLLDRIGPARFAATLRAGGLRLALPGDGEPSLAIILGGVGTSLESLVGAYAALARGGVAAAPRYTDSDPLAAHRMMSAGAAWIVREILESAPRPDRPGDVSSARDYRRVAWKTGTSYGFRDAWAIGVTDTDTVGVWIGRPDGTPNPGHFGANTALPLFLAVADALPGDAARPPRPASVRQAQVCWPLGTAVRAGEEQLCHRRRTAWLLDDTAPPTLPDRIRTGAPQRATVWVDPASGHRVAPDCAPPGALAREFARWPAALEPWLDADLRARALPPPWDARCASRAAPARAGVRIQGLEDGATIRRASGAQAAPRVTLAAIGPETSTYWLVNGQLARRVPAGSSLDYTFAASGRYEITVVDERGQWDRIRVSVID